jgi:DNA-binding transcriptional LysR family regulator
MVGQFCTDHPAVELELHEAADDVLLERLRKRTLDVAVVARDADDLEVTALRRTPLVVALAEAHPLADAGSVRVADLRTEPLVAVRNGFENLVTSVFGGHLPPVAFEVAETASALALAEYGVGVVVLPALLAEVRPAAVAVLALEPAVTIELGLAISPADGAPPLARAFAAAAI